MNQNGGKCRIREHQQQNAYLICTQEYCDQISRYLCKYCFTRNLHRHNQPNQDHIMDLKNLCNIILNMIKQHKSHEILLEDWISQFKELDKILGKHDEDSISNTQVLQYEHACILKKKEPFRVLNHIEQELKKICHSYICVECFNDKAHDHKNILKELESDEKYIQNRDTDIFTAVYVFQSIMEQWFQKPKYNQEKINKIEQIFLSNNCSIDYEQLIQLIFIKNRTYNNQRLYKTLLVSINKLFKLQLKDAQQQVNLQIQYDHLKSFDKTYFYELKSDFPQFIVSSNEQDFIFQDQNNFLVVGDLQTKQIKQIQILNKTIRIMKFSKDFNYLFCSDKEGYLLCYKTKNYKQMFQIKLHQSEIRAFLPIQNNEIVSYSGEGDLKITNFINQKVVIQIFIEEGEFFNDDFYFYQMNDRQNCIEYDEKKQLIFLGDSRIQMRHRKNMSLKANSDFQCPGLYQLQLIQNKTYLLSGGTSSLLLWKFDNGSLDQIQEKSYHDCQALKFLANDEYKRIIVMGKCFFEILDYSFRQIGLGNFDCHPSQYQIIGRKFQIEQQNSCYIILISNNQVEVQKRVLQLQE